MDPIVATVVGLGALFAGDLAKDIVKDVLKDKLKKVFEEEAKRSPLVAAISRASEGKKQSLPDTVTPEDEMALKQLSQRVKTLAQEVEGQERVEIERISESLSGLARVLTWFNQSEASKVITDTRWLDESKQFRAWTRHPWFEAFDYKTEWGRFLLLGLAAAWNFNKPFEAGEGFILFVADRYQFADLRSKLKQYRAGIENIQASDNQTRIQAQAELAVAVGLLPQEDLLSIRRYVRLVGLLENASEQSRLPQALLADINSGKVKRLGQMFSNAAYGLDKLVPPDEDPKPTLYLDFFAALASIEASFELLDGFIQPGKALTPADLAKFVAALKGLQPSYLTRGGEQASAIKAKLPLLLRELRATTTIEVPPHFCNTPDGHVRKSLKRLYPEHFNNAAGFPSLNAKGVKWVESKLISEFGETAILKLKETPVNATFYEGLLVSSLAYYAAPDEPFMYDIPLFLHNMVAKTDTTLSEEVGTNEIEVRVQAQPEPEVVAAGESTNKPFWKLW